MKCRLQSPSPTARHAFTLIEVLVVVAIIAILASLTLGVAGYATKKADISKAQAEIEKIKNGLEEYRLAYGKYPINMVANDSVELSTALWCKPQASTPPMKPFLVMKGWNNPVSATNIYDPWGNDYRYLHTPVAPFAQANNRSKFGYDLWTAGPDGIDNTDDDINNWAVPQ